MTECKHVLGQGFNIAYMQEYVYCINCKKKWSKEEVTKCLNATECLNAEDAHHMADYIQTNLGGIAMTFVDDDLNKNISQLRAYVRELEKEE